MDMYKQATREGLRFPTSRGPLTTEQLWDLSLTDLDALAVSLDAAYDQSTKKSFLTEQSDKDKTAKLRFDIALDILHTKAAEAKAAMDAKEIRQKNNKIIRLIAEKKDQSLAGKTVEELEAMLIEPQ